MAEVLDPSGAGGDVFTGILDLEVMEQLLSLDDGETGLLAEMLGLYKEDTPGRLLAMEHTLASADLADLADVAHAIKGAASTMGAPKVRQYAAVLEAAGRQADPDLDFKLILGQLKAAYEESVMALETFLAQQS